MKRFLFCASVLALMLTSAYAQSYQFGVEGGALFTAGPSEFKNSIPEGLGLESGYTFGFKAKYETPNTRFRFSGGFYLSLFNAEEDYSTTGIAYLTPFNPWDGPIGMESLSASSPASVLSDVQPGDMHAEVTSRVISLSAGAEWKITDWFASPYLAGGIMFNFYDTSDKETELVDNETTEYKISSTSIGGYLGAGAEIKLMPKLTLDLSLKYNLYGLVNNSDQADFMGEANKDVTAIYAGVGLMWRMW
jgi:opacity protein-like surface antigen